MALGLALAGAATLAADLNALRAAETRFSPAQRSLTAAEAVRLAPWRADYRHEYAVSLWESGEPWAALQQIEVALSYAPADAALWAQYEFMLAHTDPRNPRLPQVARRVAALAPNQPELRMAQADLAVQTWHQVGPELRRIWLPSLRYALEHDHDGFLVRSFRVAGESNLCSAAALLGLEQWCAVAPQARMFCSRGELTPAQAQQCRSWGVGTEPGDQAASGGGAP